MPTYEYECQSCHQRVEVVQGFSDPALTTCEVCGGSLRKVFSAVGIVFKGSGFYKNDNRKSKDPSEKAPAKVAATTSDPSSSSTSATAAPTAPAKPAAPAAASSSTD
ncbi:MAG TPA: FmdB family zinc ribbon protein [Acidimicrobiales bacterium]|nr:FmdB family zinc ribbon protein [Acidimicrobiales bacterium]